MRISASGVQSMMVVAIDQILRLAPSISGPIEPVVSSTNTTSTTGLPVSGGPVSATAAGAKTAGASAKASAIACAMCRNMRFPPDAPLSRHAPVDSGPAQVPIAARHRRIRGKIYVCRAGNAHAFAAAQTALRNRHESRWQAYAHDLARSRRLDRRRDRPDHAAAPFRHIADLYV